MSQQSTQRDANLRTLLEQHWLHCRHLESERAWFMSVYAAIIGGMAAFMAYASDVDTTKPALEVSLLVCFLVALTFVGFFLTTRWTYAFECHRVKVNRLSQIIWRSSGGGELLDPTMNIPSMRILPRSFLWIKIPDSLERSTGNLFRTRYWFALFYFLIHTGLVVFSIVGGFPAWVSVIAGAACLVASGLGFGFHISLGDIEKVKKVVLEGCNGEWAQKHYLPFLLGQATEGSIELWAIDIVPMMKLRGRNVSLWQTAQGTGNAHYIDKEKDKKSYERIYDSDYVFIVTPGHCHCKTAGFWMEHLAKEGKILIEKPLDTNAKAVRTLKDRIEDTGREESIFTFDHYLARADGFLRRSNRYVKRVGDDRQIAFRILENDGITPGREDTLNEGMILDLFCHVLAVVCATVGRDLTCSATGLQAIKPGKVKKAQYTGAPISGETFAHIEFTVNNTNAVSDIGVCVGDSQDKSMHISGSESHIYLDFLKDEFSILNSKGNLKKQGKLNTKHVESFLERILKGRQHPLSIPGVMSLEAASGILDTLLEAKNNVGHMPEYTCGEPLDKILEVLGERKVH